jgi:CheY-like chemotaxis protein
VRPARLVDEVITMVLADADAKGLRLVSELDSIPDTLLGDPTRLQQALLNYAANAVKFTEAGSITLRIRLERDETRAVLLRFEVEDTGIGISEEAQLRLFNAFEQADNSMTRQYGGNGLGLAITRKIAELMGGETGVRSTLGVGSTFWFTARLKRSRPQAVIAPTNGEDAEEIPRREYADSKILLVEDEPLNREIARALLEDVGLAVSAAEDGREAVSLAAEQSYALILMDMQMSHLDGLEATREIRRLTGYKDTPILAMTANAFAEDKQRRLAAGMNDFVSKPVHPSHFFTKLLTWLNTISGQVPNPD